MLKILETRRDELQAQKSALWDEIVAIKSQYKDMTDRQCHRSGLDVLFVRYNYVNDHLDLYSGAWANGVMLSDDKRKVYDWLREMPERVGLRPAVIDRDASLEDERRQAIRLVVTLF